MNKVYPDAPAALAGLLRDGMTIMAGGFGLCGIPEKLQSNTGSCSVNRRPTTSLRQSLRALLPTPSSSSAHHRRSRRNGKLPPFPSSWHPPPILCAPALSQVFLVLGATSPVFRCTAPKSPANGWRFSRRPWSESSESQCSAMRKIHCIASYGMTLSRLVLCSDCNFALFVVSGLDKLPAVISTMKQDGFDAMTLLSDAQFFSGQAADNQPRCDASTSGNV